MGRIENSETAEGDALRDLIDDYEDHGLTPRQASSELGLDADDLYHLVNAGLLSTPEFPDGFDWHPRWSWAEVKALKGRPEDLTPFRRTPRSSDAVTDEQLKEDPAPSNEMDRLPSPWTVEDWEENGLTPSEACRELNLGVDDLLSLVLEGHYLPEAGPDDLCWPAIFSWARIKSLKADPELLASFRTSQTPPLDDERSA